MTQTIRVVNKTRKPIFFFDTEEIQLRPGVWVNVPAEFAMQYLANMPGVELDLGDLLAGSLPAPYLLIAGPADRLTGWGNLAERFIHHLAQSRYALTYQPIGFPHEHKDTSHIVKALLTRNTRLPTKDGAPIIPPHDHALVFSLPYNLPRVPARRRILYSMYEATTFPARDQGLQWPQYVNQYAEALIVPSKHQYQVWRDYKGEGGAQVTVPIHICPLGVDTTMWKPVERPQRPEGTPFTILLYGTLSSRKSPVETVTEVCYRAFRGIDDWKLILKTTYGQYGAGDFGGDFISDPHVEKINTHYTLPQMWELCAQADVGCVTDNVSIHTDTGIKRASEITANDGLLTHRGRFRHVTGISKRFYEGEIIHIQTRYGNTRLELTPEHPVLAIRGTPCPFTNPETPTQCKPCCRKIRYVEKNGKINTCAKQYFRDYKPEWLPASVICKGDFLVYPRYNECKDTTEIWASDWTDGQFVDGKLYPDNAGRDSRHNIGIPNVIAVDDDLLRLFGLYVAEGFSSHQSVNFALHKKEVEYALLITRVMSEKFGLSFKIKRNTTENGIVLWSSSTIMAKMLVSLFGHGARNKHIPLWILRLPPDKLKQFMWGLWAGDGFAKENSYSLGTASYTLANQIRMALSKLGVFCGLNWRGTAQYPCWHIDISGPQLNTLDWLPGGIHPYRNGRKHQKQNTWMDADYLYLEVRKVEHESFADYVYNWEVEEDNSYVCDNVAVHNCFLSRFEGYGLPPLEMMSTGLPVILTDYSGLADNIGVGIPDIPVAITEITPAGQGYQGLEGWGEPNWRHAAIALRREYEEWHARGRTQSPLGRMASLWVQRERTWEQATDKLVKILGEYVR